jgi:hypothetical protein
MNPIIFPRNGAKTGANIFRGKSGIPNTPRIDHAYEIANDDDAASDNQLAAGDNAADNNQLTRGRRRRRC